MKAVAVVGFKGTGKTTVAELLVRGLKARGFRVAALKHAHSGITLYGDDSSRLFRAGADVSVALAESETVECRRGKLSLWQYISSLRGYDFLVVEGFKSAFPGSKIVVASSIDEARQLTSPLVIAYTGRVAKQAAQADLPAPVIDAETEPERLVDLTVERSIEPLPALNCGFCKYGSCVALAEAIARGEATHRECTVLASRVRLLVDGKPVELNPFVQDVFRNVVLGLVATLKGVEQNPKRIGLEITL